MELPFLGQLATQGLLGLLLALSLFANWYFIKTIQTLNDKRVEDAKEITSKILDPLNTIKSNSELLISLFQQFLSKNGK
jgi:hypothetical protein